MKTGITAYSIFTPEGLFKNGELQYKPSTDESFAVVAREAYRSFGLSYPKFFKMDELCKLAFLTAEVLLSEHRIIGAMEGADVALVIGNQHSSIASDEKHYQSFQDRSNYFPSPAVFVYTLPNIMLGELCIRHGITGENSCFLMDSLDSEFLYRYVQDGFENEEYQYCITGWVDYSGEGFKAALFLVEKDTAENNIVAKFKPDFKRLIPA